MASNKDSVSNHVWKLIQQLNSKNSHDKLVLVACAFELLRRAQQSGPQNVRALVDFMARVADVSWGSIPFSVTQKVLHDSAASAAAAAEYGITPDRLNDILLRALAEFAALVEQDGGADENASSIFDALVSVIAEMEERAPKKPATAAEIFAPQMLTRVFKPVHLTPAVLQQLGAEPVLFNNQMLSPARPGPALRGLAFDCGINKWHIILESGEFIRRPKDDAAVRLGCTVLYEEQPLELLAYTALAADQLAWAGVLNAAQMQFILAGGLGTFVVPIARELVAKENAILLENVIDIDRESFTLSAGTTGAVGAAVRYAVPDTQRDVVITAAPSQRGPYVTAKLVERQPDGSENVLMRLDYPRHLSARGVYVFPLQQGPVAISIVY